MNSVQQQICFVLEIYVGIQCISSFQATFDCLLKTYGFLTPDFWEETRFAKSPYQEFTDLLLAKPSAKVAFVEDVPERVDAWSVDGFYEISKYVSLGLLL